MGSSGITGSVFWIHSFLKLKAKYRRYKEEKKKTLLLLIPEYHCLDKITENWVLFSKGGKSIIFQVFHCFHFLTPQKFLVMEIERHL